MRKAAYKSLLHPGVSGFHAVLGGNRDPDGTYARGSFFCPVCEGKSEKQAFLKRINEIR